MATDTDRDLAEPQPRFKYDGSQGVWLDRWKPMVPPEATRQHHLATPHDIEWYIWNLELANMTYQAELKKLRGKD